MIGSLSNSHRFNRLDHCDSDENCFSKVFDVVAYVEVSAGESIGFILVKADSLATA